MSRVTHTVTIQFLMHGMGTEDDIQRREDLQRLVHNALKERGLGISDGEDAGSGSMNIFFTVQEPIDDARQLILDTLKGADQLDDNLIVAHGVVDQDEDDDSIDEVWWPEDYPYDFTVFGPMWRGELSTEELDQLDDDLRSLQGCWVPRRFDSADGSTLPTWAEAMEFYIVRDRLTVRRGLSLVSDARIVINPKASPSHIDMLPTMGPNKGIPSYGIYALDGDTLHLVNVPPEEHRPSAFAPEDKLQPGRMILARKTDQPED